MIVALHRVPGAEELNRDPLDQLRDGLGKLYGPALESRAGHGRRGSVKFRVPGGGCVAADAVLGHGPDDVWVA